MQYGQRVEILGGLGAFVGKTGRVTGPREYKDGQTWLHRVTLDEPINVEGVGVVEDDLWSSEFLKKIK